MIAQNTSVVVVSKCVLSSVIRAVEMVRVTFPAGGFKFR
jgi:hypothetical protein